jgi:predicted DNA-binding WGR domain protein
MLSFIEGGAMTTREFHFKDDTSDKFWKITLAGKSHTVHFGRRGTNGQEQTKEFGSDEEARKSYEKLVAEKQKKGYVEAVSGAAPPAGEEAGTLEAETIAEIRVCVRSGFYTQEEIVTQFCEERYEPDELNADAVEAAVAKALAALREEQKSWPHPTDCDRLTQAFQALNAKGVIALENAGMTQSDGYDDTLETYEGTQDKSRIIGYCFYHGQDLERAVQGEGLYLAFGPIDPQKESTEGPRVGKIIVEELQRLGLQTKWNGTFKERILIEKLDWKRRITSR